MNVNKASVLLIRNFFPDNPLLNSTALNTEVSESQTVNQEISSCDEFVPSDPETLSQHSYHDQNTDIEIVNEKLKVFNASPIITHTLKNDASIQNKMTKISTSIKGMLGLDKGEAATTIEKEAEDCSEIVRNIKDKCHSPDVGYAEKIRFLILLSKNWSIRTICEKIEVSTYMGRLAQKVSSATNFLVTSKRKSKFFLITKTILV